MLLAAIKLALIHLCFTFFEIYFRKLIAVTAAANGRADKCVVSSAA